MATVLITPVSKFKQIDVSIELNFTQSEVGKEYLLKGEVKVYEGRTNLISTLKLNEVVLTPSSTKPIILSQQFPEPQHGFQLSFVPSHKLYIEL